MGIGEALLVALSFAAGLGLLFFLGRVLLLPIKWILKLALSGVLGFAALYIINLVGGVFGVSIALNPINALITGVFGIPGIILLLILQAFL